MVDYLWYRRKVSGSYSDSTGFDVIDDWGRLIPDPVRWPSSNGRNGFTEVAKRVHGMGLKFGIHVMSGISLQAVNANTPILDTTKAHATAYEESGKQWRAKDIALTNRACAWMPHGFMSVNTTLPAGKAFLRSLYTQYASWGVDFVKLDCVFGDDLNLNEITYVSDVLRKLSYPIVYSLSPGTSVTPAMAKDVSNLVNMYRITGDDWDTWDDVAAHFDVTRDFANSGMIGSNGLRGKSWPDLDMLPLGWLTDAGSNEGPHRKSRLTLEEQRTQITLWSMAKSPLMFGGDLRQLDDTTYNLITNSVILEIDSFSQNNKEFPHVTGTKEAKGIMNWLFAWDSRNQMEVHEFDKRVLGLTSCKDMVGKGWSVEALDENLEEVCWKDDSEAGNKYDAPFCLYKKKLPLASDEDLIDKEQYKERIHVLTTDDTTGFCLDASPRRKLTSKEYRKGSFSPCKGDANQVWKWNLNGTLSNSYSGLCATVNTVKANVGRTGVRAWVATGTKGEIYAAFFNLNSVKTVISAKISDIAKVLHGINVIEGSCTGTEVWSGKNLGVIQGLISMAVEPHGCVLFVLKCT